MSEKKDVKIQARLSDEEDKKLVEETLEAVKQNKGLNNIGQAMKYVFQEFNRTNNVSEKSLNSYFSSELEELKGIGERIPQLFQLMIEKSEREIEKTQNQTSTQMKKKNEIIEEKSEYIKKMELQHTDEMAARAQQIREMKEKHAAELSSKDKEIDSLKYKLNEELNNTGKAVKEIRLVQEENQKLKDRNEGLEKSLMQKESLHTQLLQEKQSLKEDYQKLEKLAEEAVASCKELEEKFEIQRQKLIDEHRQREEKLKNTISSLESRLNETNQKHMEFLQGILSKDTQKEDEKGKKRATNKSSK